MSFKKILFSILSVIALITPALLVGSSTYYVSQTGSGTSCILTSPCSYSTGYGKLRPGDTLQIVGTLTVPVVISKSGTETSPITIKGKINAPNTVQTALLIAGSNIILDSIDISGGESFGIRIGTSGSTPHNIDIRNFSVHDSVWGNRNGDRCIGGSGGWGRGLTVGITAYDIDIHNGLVYNNCGEGLAFTQSHDIRIHDVTTYDNFSRNVYIGNAYNITLDRITSYCENPNFFRNGNPARGMGLAIETTNYSLVGNQLHDIIIRDSAVRGCLGINFYAEVANQFPSNVTISNVCFSDVPYPQINIPDTNIIIIPCGLSATNTPTATRTTIPSKTPTASPTATFTPNPTFTPTPTITLCVGGIPEFVQKDRLYYYCLYPVP